MGSWDQKIFSIGHCGSAFFPREHTVLVLVLLFCPGPARPAPHAAVLVLPFCPGPAKPAPLQLFWFCRFALGRQNLLSYRLQLFWFCRFPRGWQNLDWQVLPVQGKTAKPKQLWESRLCRPRAKRQNQNSCREAGFAGPRQSSKTKTAVGEQALPAP